MVDEIQELSKLISWECLPMLFSYKEVPTLGQKQESSETLELYMCYNWKPITANHTKHEQNSKGFIQGQQNLYTILI